MESQNECQAKKLKRTIQQLVSSDNQTFEVDHRVAMEFPMIRNMFEDLDDNVEVVCLPDENVHSKILGKVLEYCEYHAHAAERKPEESERWDADFIKRIDDNATLCALLKAANFFDLAGLRDLGWSTARPRTRSVKSSASRTSPASRTTSLPRTKRGSDASIRGRSSLERTLVKKIDSRNTM